MLAAVVVALAGCFGDDRPQVETERVTSGEVVETVSAPARVEAAARQDVATAVSGVVVALEVSDGEQVGAGEVVVRLESSQVELAQEQAAAARAAAGQVGGIRVDGQGAATVDVVNRAVADLDETVSPRITRAREDAAAIEDEQQRAAALSAIEAVEVSYLTTRAGLIATGHAVARQQDGLAQSLSQALNQAVAQATAAQRAQAEAAARAAAAQADDLALAAPFAGTVQLGEAAATDGIALPGEVPPELAGLAGSFGGLADSGGGGTLRVGAPVVAGQTLLTVFDLSTKYVNADVDEVDAPSVAIGQRATVLVDSFPDVELDGVVESVRVEAGTTEAGGVGYPVRIRLLEASDDVADGLRVGMTASAEIDTRTVEDELVVPSRALLRRDDGTVVFVVRDGVAVMVPVRVRALGEERAAVEGDVRRGDRVVVSGYEEIEDGAEVRY